jgi:hypothetical protein
MTESVEIQPVEPVVKVSEFEAWVREFTGGPNGCQVPHGGTCIRPDILLHNDKTCNKCDYNEFCLCSSKKLAKRKPALANGVS